MRSTGWIFVGLSMAVIAGCSNAHEGEGDGSLPGNDAGPVLPDAPIADTGPVVCGPTTCAPGLVCCNSSCGICTVPGAGCIDIACADAGPGPRRCGGIIGATCGPNEFCDYPDGSSCGADDSEGLCQPRPTDCPDPGGTPMCGCDGTDYIGSCGANLSGTDVAHAGRCHPTTRPPSLSAARSCGPTDGPAWTFFLSNDSPPVCASSDPRATRITVFGDLSDVTPGRVYSASGTSCPVGTGAPCIGISGTMTFQTFVADDHTTFSYELHGMSGDTRVDLVADDVSVDVWCSDAPLCG